jgi:predicted acyl esterase
MPARVRDDLRHAVAVVETEWITLSDGTRLAAVWLPQGAGAAARPGRAARPPGRGPEPGQLDAGRETFARTWSFAFPRTGG